MAILSNKKFKSAMLHFTANTTMTLIGNTTNGSNIAIAGEEITGATITQIFYGSSNAAYWQVNRGANTVAVLSGTQHANYQAHGAVLSQDNTGTLVVTLNGAGAVGYIMLEVQKIVEPTGSDYFKN